MPDSRNLLTGIAAGIVTGMLWGIVFVVPQILPDYSPLELSLGRYFFFALASCATLKTTWRHWQSFSARDKWQVFWLSASGFWLYTILLFWAVNAAGGILTTLVIGLLPITIPLAAKRGTKPAPLFLLGLGIILAGLGVLEAVPLFKGTSATPLIGWIPLLSCLVLWTWFGLRNTDFVQKHPEAKVSLTNLMGLSSFVILAVLCAFVVDLPALLHHAHLGAFLFWSAVIGFGSSWLANWFWNICSGLVPATISGPLVVAETTFGLIYTFIFQQRLPMPAEVAAICLFALGVSLALHAEIKGKS